MSSSSRLFVGLTLVLLSAVLIICAFSLDPEQTTGGLLLNLATEFCGICVTILGIDFILVADQKRQKARSIAHAAGRDLNRVVWVWLGGKRGFDPGRDLALLEAVGAGEDIAQETRTLLTDLGARAEHTRRVESRILQSFSSLDSALEEVEQLYTAQQLDQTSTVIAAYLMGGIRGYARTLGMSTTRPVIPVDGESAIESQRGRHSRLKG